MRHLYDLKMTGLAWPAAMHIYIYASNLSCYAVDAILACVHMRDC